ncbi:hypothetical protein G6F62_004414 [Rhizopus arrhizus]|nr:hypothetical protein G6F62_004414 [Rhizopus arrhizus]KAG1398552.1 hypothetical protein G6F60_008297 [Rhizopus arrhizus]
MNLVSITLASLFCAISFSNAAPHTPKTKSALRLPGLEKIKHVVYFMQENRSFDMYYGTMYGVRGFQDPNVGIQENGLSLFYQPCSASPDIKNSTKYLLPYQLKGARAGCTAGGSNGWEANHKALNGYRNNNWPDGNSPASMGYLNRTQIPFLYALADEFTIADMYFQSVTGSTDPNRVVWMSGTNRGDPNDMVLEDNTQSTPLGWSTYPEALTKANITWQVYQDKDNFDDNALAWFKYWQDLPDGPERSKGLGFLGLNAFYEAAAKGTLPQFSIIVGPMELSEHPINTPLAGSWLQQQVVNAVMNGKNWNETALFINYDESGGYFDHVIPPQEPQEDWATDKFSGGKAPIGYGPRVPMVIISPWTRGGNVFSETADHRSTLRFMEEWVGKDEQGNYLAPAVHLSKFSRKTSSNLVGAFDFDHPDYSIPKFNPVAKPAQVLGKWSPTEMCEIIITAPKTKPPYGNQVFPVVESGARRVRGAVTEGRKLSFQTADTILQLSDDKKSILAKKVTQGSAKKVTPNSKTKDASHLNPQALFQLILTGTANQFKLQSVHDPELCLNVWGSTITIGECKGTSWYFERTKDGYLIRDVGTDSYLAINEKVVLQNSPSTSFQIYSVTI